ncbi:conserved hypothetical protein [Histoplasma capsulatum var. duboisii H88]|uniref:Uncharacterized protein n=2 Tax=Ajellomyces capsulatus TaxID=5037 RepID=F0UDF3_AJEC8|nr:conserved hypothetical protein [Histoplasma capsulatum H143]EGC42694.1 conserved hypothetical protein [Histoplasma capsulatum var. duboisii H88]
MVHSDWHAVRRAQEVVGQRRAEMRTETVTIIIIHPLTLVMRVVLQCLSPPDKHGEIQQKSVQQTKGLLCRQSRRVVGVALIIFVSPDYKNHKSLEIRYENSKMKQAVGKGKEGARRKCIWEKGNPRCKILRGL